MNNEPQLSHLGFAFGRNSVHTARTIMLDELTVLLAFVDNPAAAKVDYLQAIDTENCLGKRSGRTRLLTYRHLRHLYALDPAVPLFRALLYFWFRDPASRPLLALLCAYVRDGLLRASAPFIQQHALGSPVSRNALEEFLDELEPGRFSPATLKSTAQNLNSTWTKSGHLRGRRNKFRSSAQAHLGGISYALFLGYLTGLRGPALFSSEYIKLFDCSRDTALDLAVEAARRGWLDLKRIGEIIEVRFPKIITNLDDRGAP